MEYRSEGICRFCLKTYAGSAMGRHLLSCKAKKQKDEQDAARAKQKYPIYYFRITAGRYYWLHVEMKAVSKLSTLDGFLRDIWLECCGHLSSFTINGVEYQKDTEQGDWNMFFGGKASKPMTTKINLALSQDDKFDYEYDFGSTTNLQGKILGVRHGVLKKSVKILARNNPYIIECEKCGKQATDLCTECETSLCNQCLLDHECGEEMALPLVNSPRMGVCGYCGERDVDSFYEEYEKHQQIEK